MLLPLPTGWLACPRTPALPWSPRGATTNSWLIWPQHAAFAVYVLNARDVYFYAKALGARAKSNAIDCVVNRRYVQEHHHSMRPWQPGTKLHQQLHNLAEQTCTNGNPPGCSAPNAQAGGYVEGRYCCAYAIV